MDLGVSLDGQRLYVSLQGADAIGVLDAGTLKGRRRLPLGAPPFGLALTPDGLRGCATARDMDYLLPFDTRVVSAPV
jgi:YVTN family beta-propeller protein